nr:Rne/Rng family ribonuclease [Bacteroides sp. 214]
MRFVLCVSNYVNLNNKKVTSELVVDVQPKEVSIALLEDKSLVELQNEGRSASFAVGNMYLGRVKKLMPGLNACFVDVGYEKDAFLHYLDLGPQFNSLEKFVKQTLSNKKKLSPITKANILPDIDKDGTIANILKVGQEVIVQVAKEPISTKGPRLTSEISYAGRYLILIPFNDKVSVSQKIKSSEERARLKQLLQSIKPKNFGVIVRTVAEGKRVAELDTELKLLLKHWEESMVRVQKATKYPTLIYEETSRVVAMLRDLFNPSFENIHVNDETVFNEIKDYVSLIAPERASIVKHYKGNLPIFDNFGITKQIKSSFGKTVSYKSGAYLIIEHTEALHVVDVNSGNRAKNANGQEANALEVNLGAADELARQLRLRDMGGIIVIDFIDMGHAENRQKVYERMTANMQKDRARHNILPLSKFGLMQITRQRVRPAMDVNTSEDCPTCFGKGTIKSSILFTDMLESKIGYLVNKLKIKKFSLHIHPFIAAYINKGFFSLKRQWQMKYGFGIKIIPNQSLAFLEYKFYESSGEEVDMKEELDNK